MEGEDGMNSVALMVAEREATDKSIEHSFGFENRESVGRNPLDRTTDINEMTKVYLKYDKLNYENGRPDTVSTYGEIWMTKGLYLKSLHEQGLQELKRAK